MVDGDDNAKYEDSSGGKRDVVSGAGAGDEVIKL